MSSDATRTPSASYFQQLAQRIGGNTLGALLIVVSSVTVAMMMGAVKELSESYSVWQILIARTAGQLLVFLPFLFRGGGAMLKTDRPGMHVARVLFAFTGLACWFYSITHLPLAEASAIGFSKALFLVALAGVVFGERVGIIGWVASIVGFGGVLLMLDPGGAELNDAVIVAAFGALAGAGATMAIKSLTRTEGTATMMAYPAIGLTVLLAVPTALTWEPITLAALPLFALSALSGIFTQWCFITAYRYGEASVLATVEYSRLIAAAAVGYLVFAEVPGWTASIGIALIIFASLVSIRRERIRAGIFS